MFFFLSKILWFIVDPGNLLLLGLVIGSILTWTRWRRLTKWWLTLLAAGTLVLAVIPLGENMLGRLENRFPRLALLPVKVDGIIVLGGIVDQFVSKDRGTLTINGAVERLTEFVRLAKLYPKVKLVFSGGSGVLFNQNLKEADFIAPLIRELGIDPERVIFENQSKNTAENAVLTKKLINPDKDELWILITSAFHVPRAIGTFRHAGWNMLGYPVDYRLKKNLEFKPRFNLRSGMNAFAAGLHEWIGLTFYWLTGRTNELFPGPLKGDSS